MGILSDRQIKELAQKGMIEPFIDKLIVAKFDIIGEGTPFDVGMKHPRQQSIPVKVISYGLSSYGYDARLKDEFFIYHNANSSIIDPKNFGDDHFIRHAGDGFCLIPPNSFVLCETVEYIRIPEDCVMLILAKSTYARCGLVVNATIGEPGWEGNLTLELSNTTPLPIKVYAGEGIVQLMFIRAEEPCSVSYRSRKGKYQGQRGITTPKV